MKDSDFDDNATKNNPDESAESIANDRFIHGLLGFIHRDSEEEKERRIQGVFDQIESPEMQERPPQIYKLRRIIPFASAAMIMVIAFTLFVVTPQPKAYAIVNSAIEATRSSAALRYEIRESDDELGYIGTLDMKESKSRIQIQTPHGHDFSMGTDDQGDWSVRRDGTVERSDPRGAAPRWLNIGESTILIASLDDFLIELKESYELEIDSESTSRITKLIAIRNRSAIEPGPDAIQVWIHTDTQLVERLELAWGPEYRRKGAADERPRPNHDSSRPPPQHPPRHQRPHREHSPSPNEPIENFWFPEFLGPTPRFDAGRDPPPPPMIIFQRVESVEFSEDYFSPPSD